MEQVTGYCTLCRSRCGSVNHVENGRLVAVTPLAGHPTGGALCAKGRAAPEMMAESHRLLRPLRRTNPRGAADPGWREIEWPEALDEVAARLAVARRRDGAESVAFAVTTPSGTPMVDSFEWVERFVRVFGSPNLIYAVEVCGWHKDYAHALTFGRGIGVPDLEHTDTMLLWGHNPARTWLAQAARIAAARQRGARVVVVDPNREGSSQQADLWLRVRPGADGALALGAIRHLLHTGRFDHGFVARWSNGPYLVDGASGALLRAADLWPDADPAARVVMLDGRPAASGRGADTARAELFGSWTLRLHDGRACEAVTVMHALRVAVERYTPDEVARLAWLDEAELAQFNAIFENAPRLSYHSWTGVGQHTNATQTDRAIATLYALTGACDRKGGNLWTVAPPYRAVNGYRELLSPVQRAKALGLDELPLGPPSLGWITARDFCRAVLQQDPYPVRTLVSFGTNLLVSQAETARNLEALQALDFHVHVDMSMNPTAMNADIVLPANMPWEREALKLGFEITQAAVEHVQLRPRMVEPAGESRADYEIVLELARRLGLRDAFFGADMDACWNHQLAPLGIDVQALRRQPEGIRFPQPFAHEKYKTLRDGQPVGFPTHDGRVQIHCAALHDIGQPALPSHVEPADTPARHAGAYPLVLSTAKSGWFVHSSHRYVASLRRKSPDPQVYLSTEAARDRGIASGDWVRVRTPYGEVALRAKINADLHANVAIAEFGWWQGCEGLGRADGAIVGPASSNINAIMTDRHRDPVSGSVPLRATVCDIVRDDARNRGSWSGAREFVLARKRGIAHDVAEFRLLACDAQALPDFLPGQHVIVSMPGGAVRRAYSLTGPNRQPAHLSIAVRRVRDGDGPAGLMSNALHALEEGARVLLSAPAGVFTPPLRTARPVILMASGIGITPFHGYLEALAQDAGPAPSVLLVHACRDGSSHPYGAELKRLAQRIGSVRTLTVYAEPASHDVPGRDYQQRGRLDFAWLSPETVAARPLVYLCGSPGFLALCTDALAARGIPRFDIFSETFTSEKRVPDTLAPQPIEIEAEQGGFTWDPAAGTLLDAAERAGLSLPSGCRVGQCESCAMHIVSGQVAHLIDFDGSADTCLTCQAVPITPLTLRR
ncbi:molybdopterin-dependent oxidoreductase [Bordetella bronchiseptica]|uniref:molybdopterin-dependent oxidoreductase n=1 Tax=Bordetella bronchiseptica TaxID=518 RepID=UPI000460CC79|nr:molybdopterin-dependent oxidoreductase [Bordetella bronchiseptica]KDC37916.1 molybdopterin oxidoreductase [Bordetella bronchiseptica M435/02/3]